MGNAAYPKTVAASTLAAKRLTQLWVCVLDSAAFQISHARASRTAAARSCVSQEDAPREQPRVTAVVKGLNVQQTSRK